MSREQRIPDGLKRLPRCKVGELISACNITRSVNVFHVRPKLIIDGNTFLRIPHTGLLEIQTENRRPPSRSNKEHFAACFAFRRRHDNLLCIGTDSICASAHETNALLLKDSSHDIPGLRFIFGQHPLTLAVPPIMALLNKYSFDILAFERLLSRRFGYPKDKNGVSIKSFITDKWGVEVCAYFENHFLKT